MGLRIIVFMGAATFLFLMLMAFGLKKSLQPATGARVPAGAATSPFQEARAWADVEALRGLGSDAELRQDFVLKALRKAGLKTRRISRANQAPTDTTGGTALVGIVEGNRPGVLLLCTSLNAPSAGSDYGAADGAWLLEMARLLGSQRDGRSVWIAFLDDSGVPAPKGQAGLSRAGAQLVDALKESGELGGVDVVLAVQGIGDCSLAVQKEAGAPPELTEILWNTASREGYGKFFGKLPGRVQGPHLNFREAGVPAVSLSDTRPGPYGPRDRADIASATPEFCRESLRAVGDVIYHALAPMEGYLDETGIRSDEQ
jgi:hypothetical protein